MTFIDDYITGSVLKLTAAPCKSIALSTICEYMIRALQRIVRFNDLRDYYDLRWGTKRFLSISHIATIQCHHVTSHLSCWRLSSHLFCNSVARLQQVTQDTQIHLYFSRAINRLIYLSYDIPNQDKYIVIISFTYSPTICLESRGSVATSHTQNCLSWPLSDLLLYKPIALLNF